MVDMLEQQRFNSDDAAIWPLRRSPLDLLNTVDWDFSERTAQSDIETIHPYPARFISEIPSSLLAALPAPHGTAVLDLFCGSGTTLVECQRRGIPAVGIDLNPIACLISRIKTAVCPRNLEAHANRAVDLAMSQPAPSVPAIPNLDHWFKQAVQEELSGLTNAINTAPSAVRESLRLALSSIIVRVSNQESDTRYAAIHKNIQPGAVSKLFLSAVERMGTVLRARNYRLSRVEVIEGDTLEVRSKQIVQPIGLVITSPPYPNAYEYWLYHKYRMWWLGFDPLSVKAREIGARAHFFKRNHHTATDFVRQMQRTFSLLDHVVIPDGYVCFVVGRSRIHGQNVDNAQIVEEAGRAFGFHRYFVAERTLLARRKSFNLSHANIKTETILVLQKGGR